MAKEVQPGKHIARATVTLLPNIKAQAVSENAKK